MKGTIYALALATAGLLGSCSYTPDEETVIQCREREATARGFAKTYKIKSIERELDSKDWCYNDIMGGAHITQMEQSNLILHCEGLEESAYNLLKEDPFKAIIFTKQDFCSSRAGF